jgi:hypothetical protein
MAAHGLLAELQINNAQSQMAKRHFISAERRTLF